MLGFGLVGLLLADLETNGRVRVALFAGGGVPEITFGTKKRLVLFAHIWLPDGTDIHDNGAAAPSDWYVLKKWIGL